MAGSSNYNSEYDVQGEQKRDLGSGTKITALDKEFKRLVKKADKEGKFKERYKNDYANVRKEARENLKKKKK